MELERRENPSNYYWEGTVSSDAQDPANWSTDSGYEPLPGPLDSLYFEAVEEFDENMNSLGMVSYPCTNFSGDFGDIVLQNDYNSTVTLSGAVNAYGIYMNTGTIDQPVSGTDITIEMYMIWEDGGTLNSTSNLATVHFLGGSDSYFSPNEGTLTLGSTLSFENSGDSDCNATLGAGVYQFKNTASVILGGAGGNSANMVANAGVIFKAANIRINVTLQPVELGLCGWSRFW